MRSSHLLVIVINAIVLAIPFTIHAQLVVDFEDLSLAPESSAEATAADATPFASHGISFNRSWNNEFNCCPGAWAYSNKTDQTTAGFGNSYSAYNLPSGGGFDGSANFGIAQNFAPGESSVSLPSSTTVDGMYVTNTTFGYLAVANGDDGNDPPFVKGPFEAGDWFKLDIIGQDTIGTETGRVPFYLADFRNGATTVIDHWTWVDLSELGNNVASLAFELDSTDLGDFGMNTPAYFAMDNLTLQTALGDFDGDSVYGCADIDMLVESISSNEFDATFDLDESGAVNGDDLSLWLATAGAANLPSGAPYLPGDANLDGAVNGSDFLTWNAHKFTETAAWCSGDFDANGAVDGSDFLIWNTFKFQSADQHAVPEPALAVWVSFALALFIRSSTRSR